MPDEGTINFNRDIFIKKLDQVKTWDMIIIGGGATGIGIALDAASRGYTILLLEQADFSKGTSSRSTKLVHGGVRYLAQGNIGLVYTALHERGLLLKNAAHLVKQQSFIIPCYSWFETIKYLAGLKLYDLLSGRLSFGRSRFLNRKKLIQQLPSINTKKLIGGVEYYDGQFDDARLAVNLAQTSAEKGGVLLNYFKVTSLLKENKKITGVQGIDLESKKKYQLQAKVVINATGVFVDDILQMDEPEKKPLVRPSQGVHIVLHKSFLKNNSAVMIPKTTDGRLLFAVPWHDHVLIGTTDTPIDKYSLEPVVLDAEVQFILNNVKKYLSFAPCYEDILSVFAGLRPLAAPQKNTSSTKEISREHKLMVSQSGLITITGGKWTTYRKMAEETVDKAVEQGKFNSVPCITKNIFIHGCTTVDSKNYMSVYGTDEQCIRAMIKENPSLNKTIVNHFPYTGAEVIWAVKNEMARTVEDVLARRLRILFLNAGAAIEAAPAVARIMATELGYNEDWVKEQVKEFTILANQYLWKPASI